MKISISKKTIYLYLILFCFIIASGSLLLLSNNVILNIIALIILVFGAMYVVGFDLVHPYVWFSFVYLLYSISYPILYLNGIMYDLNTYTKSLMFSQWLALVFFLLAVSPSKVDYSKLKNIRTNLISSKFVYIVIAVILIITIYEFSTGGYTHKKDIYSESVLASIGFRAALVFLVIYAINLSITALEKEKLDFKQIILTFSLIFLLVFFSGERDYLIRFFVISMFIYYVLIKKSKLSIEIIILGIFSLISIPILAKYKYFGLTGERMTSEYNFFISFITSEFQSASKNLQIILLDESSKGLFNGLTFVSAIIRSLYLDIILGFERISSVAWYNETYFTEGRAGQGFTLVGDGYINFGYIGIIALFIFIGILIRFIYSISNKGVYYFVFYILTIPVFMYGIRADLANILSPIIKHNILTFLFIKIILEIIYGKHIEKNKKEVSIDGNQ